MLFSFYRLLFAIKSVAPLSSIEQHVESDLESSNPFGMAFAVAISDALVRDSHGLRDRSDPFPKVAEVASQCLGCCVHFLIALKRDFGN
jgi:hypothetical protein